MEGNLPGEFIDEIRTRFDIVEIIAQYMQLKKSGRNYFGLCPFHGEKTPSFSVSQDKQIFHCFGCGEGGNLYTFLMKVEGFSFPEAVAELAKRAGVPLPETVLSPARQQQQQSKQRLLDMVALAARYYEHQLQQPIGENARAYLQKRTVQEDTQKTFQLGFAPHGWQGLKNFLLKKGFKEQELLTAGLITENAGRSYDRFRERIIYPICDQRGQVIAFGGRTLGDGQPKYLNSPETPLFDKSKTLYALHVARESIRHSKKVIILEGYMDVIAVFQAGIRNAVASLGTSLTDAQARLLRNQADEVIIVYDADTAGQAATWRGLQILRNAGCLVKVGCLPQGLDPDDFIRRYGGDAFRAQIIEASLLLVDYQLASLTRQYRPDHDADRMILFPKIIEVLASVDNAMEQEDYLQKAANLLKLPPHAIRQELLKVRPQNPGPRLKQPLQIKVLPKDGAAQKAPLQILALWARFPALKTAYKNHLEPDDIPPEYAAAFTAAQATSAAFTPANILDLLPDEKYRQILSRLLIDEDYDEKTAKKALDDCVKYLKCVRIASRRKEIEALMAKLDPGIAKGEIAELSKEWLTLRRLEESINQTKEGGKGVG